MEVIVLAGVAGLGYWLYRCGKRSGSRKGYGVGRHRRRR